MLPHIPDAELQKAASDSFDAFLQLVCDATLTANGGALTADTMPSFSPDQITLTAYKMLHEELVGGGFVQLIHNGLGPFIFLNPFAKAIRLWGQALDDVELGEELHAFSKQLYRGRELFEQYGNAIAAPCTYDEFVALYEQYPDFDTLDEYFVEHEEQITYAVAAYVDAHLADFAIVD